MTYTFLTPYTTYYLTLGVECHIVIVIWTMFLITYHTCHSNTNDRLTL